MDNNQEEDHHGHHQEQVLGEEVLDNHAAEVAEHLREYAENIADRVNSNENVLNNVERDLVDNGAQRRNNRTGNNLNPRDRLFYALFIKIGQLYASLVPKKLRTLLEVIVLLKGLLLFSFLSYLHFSFGKVPMNCLNSTIGSWPRDGILRVQIQTEANYEIQLPRFYSHHHNIVLFHPCHSKKEGNSSLCTSLATDLESFYKYHSELYAFKGQCYRMNLSDFMYAQRSSLWKSYEHFEYIFSDKKGNLFKGFMPGEIVKEDKVVDLYDKYFASSKPERHYIFEYAQEFGFLRISKEARSRLKIPMKTVTFDPNKEKCFGDMFSRFILKYFLGYDDVLMNSIKKIADAENNTGYMLNVVTGDHYKFVSWGMGRSSYFVSLLLMFLFTISISTLLRYCHQQVFFFIIHLLQMMDMNVVLAFPIAPLFTVILSLVGMETIMSEYFNDTTTSFYIILIVWAVDQFDTICCHTEISQKYWLRFFYLYHFIFYSYHYRFNGQYSSIALAATWFLIQHSMLYFLHNYELPAIENEANNGRRDEDAYLDEAVQIIVEGIEMVAGQQNNVNHQHQPNGQPPAAPAAAAAPNRDPAAAEDEEPSGGDVAEAGGEGGGAAVEQPPLHYIVHRVILFATDTSFLQTLREFLRLLLQRVNLERVDVLVGDARENQEAAVANTTNDGREDAVESSDGVSVMRTESVAEQSDDMTGGGGCSSSSSRLENDECVTDHAHCDLQLRPVATATAASNREQLEEEQPTTTSIARCVPVQTSSIHEISSTQNVVVENNELLEGLECGGAADALLLHSQSDDVNRLCDDHEH